MKFGELKFLLKHSSIYGLGSVIGQAISFLLLPLYTRYLTPADYGVMALVDVARGLIGLVISLGLVNALGRFYYEYEEQEQRNLVISSAYWVVFAVIIISLPLVWYLSSILSELLFHTNEYTLVFQVALLSLLFGLLVDLGINYLRVRAQSIHFIKITLARMTLVISCNIYFIVFLQTGVIGIFYSSLLSAIIFAFFLTITVLRKTSLSFSYTHAKEMVHYSFPLIFSNIFRVITNESDKLFINSFFSPFETGIYSIAQKIGSSLHALVTSPFLQAYLPRRFQIMKEANAKQEYANILDYYLLAICAAGTLLSIFSREIIVTMTSQEYYAAAAYIPAIVLSMVVFGMKYHFEIGIVITKKTKIIAYINGLSCVVNVLLNWILIKHFGIVGAIISVNVSYLLTTILNLMATQRLYAVQFHYSRMFQLLVLSMIIYALSLLVPKSSFIVVISLKSLLVICFLGALYVTNLIPKELITGITSRIRKKIT
ncbi:MAG: oligosaccharide flippase family protein [Candidatus Electrothrix sp. GW3-4]|uniref:oligosaccharide flippase family protein n=1 Tax=Candidatus Electrothrix sp. GW3-4 TaxID=3126740 RepID=UPI0030CE000D